MYESNLWLLVLSAMLLNQGRIHGKGLGPRSNSSPESESNFGSESNPGSENNPESESDSESESYAGSRSNPESENNSESESHPRSRRCPQHGSDRGNMNNPNNKNNPGCENNPKEMNMMESGPHKQDGNGMTEDRQKKIILLSVFIPFSVLVTLTVLILCFIWRVKKMKKVTIVVNNLNQYESNSTKELDSTRAVSGSEQYKWTDHYEKDNASIQLTNTLQNISKGDTDIYVSPPCEEEALYATLEDDMMEYIKRSSIELNAKLGSGQFGDVYSGLWHKSVDDDVIVAIKTLKEGAGAEDRVKFLQEGAIMAQFKDPNVVTMNGIVIEGEPILLVLELLSKGDLRNHLLSLHSGNNKEIAIDGHTLLSYCRQVVSGMVYLSGKGFVHRDLAARNILVSNQGICKIADFGMARDVLYETYYTSQGGMIPVKWTAPEALHFKKYSTASDVWSFGVVMFEIWSLGHKPFETAENNKITRLLDSGYRLPPPPGCPRNIYSLMMKCWHPKPSCRPSFLDVRGDLSQPDPTLLQWNKEDSTENPDLLQLGGDLQLADNMFIDLQNTYKF